MKTAIRYYSKFGHTAKMVEAVKDIVGAEPQTVAIPLGEPVDVPMTSQHSRILLRMCFNK